MRKNHFHICLFQPEIPQNTGNIARLAAATQCRLHLIAPFGFSVDDKNLRRPGLDYWPYLDLEVHQNLDSLLKMFPRPKIAFLSKKAKKNYNLLPTDTELIIFGRETSGLPAELHEEYADVFYKIQIYHSSVRSLNLANAVSIVTYHLLAERGRGVEYVENQTS